MSRGFPLGKGGGGVGGIWQSSELIGVWLDSHLLSSSPFWRFHGLLIDCMFSKIGASTWSHCKWNINIYIWHTVFTNCTALGRTDYKLTSKFLWLCNIMYIERHESLINLRQNSNKIKQLLMVIPIIYLYVFGSLCWRTLLRKMDPVLKAINPSVAVPKPVRERVENHGDLARRFPTAALFFLEKCNVMVSSRLST